MGWGNGSQGGVFLVFFWAFSKIGFFNLGVFFSFSRNLRFFLGVFFFWKSLKIGVFNLGVFFRFSEIGVFFLRFFYAFFGWSLFLN